MTDFKAVGRIVLKVSGARGPGLTSGDMTVLDAKVAAAAGSEAAAAGSAAAVSANAAAIASQAGAINGAIYPLTPTIGRTGAPVTGSVYTDVTAAFFTPMINNCTLTAVRLFAGAGMTAIAFKVFRLVSGTWTQIGSDVVKATTPNAVNNFSVAAGTLADGIALIQGDLIGWYCTGGRVTFTSIAPLNDAALFSTAGNQTSLPAVPTKNAYLQIGFDFKSSDAPLNRPRLDQVGATADQLTEFAAQSVGPIAVVTGSTISDITIAHNQPALGDGTITSVRAFALTAGDLSFRTCRRINNALVPTGPVTTVTMALGANTFAVSVPIAAGELVMFYGSTRFSTPAPGSSGGIYYCIGNQIGQAGATLPLATIGSTTPQVAFDVSYRRFAGAKIKVLTQAQYTALAVKDAATLYAVTP